jgi:hypothetical protein
LRYWILAWQNGGALPENLRSGKGFSSVLCFVDAITVMFLGNQLPVEGVTLSPNIPVEPTRRFLCSLALCHGCWRGDFRPLLGR